MTDDLTADVTRQCLKLGGEGQLFPDQARALFQAWDQRGLVAAMDCGAGKTLTSLLLPTVLDAKRPVLVVPASLIQKTRIEHAKYARDWQVANPEIISYQELGRPGGANLLEDVFHPDLLVFDEVHRIKNPDAAVTRRVLRYYEKHPSTGFCGLTGTLVRRGLSDYAHFLILALRERAPVPLDRDQLRAWCDALSDDGGNFLARQSAEDLHAQGIPTREEFRARLENWPGVVISRGETGCAASLAVNPLEYNTAPVVEQAFRTLREAWEAPDGWWLSDPMQVAELARQLALGFYYAWDPRPPPELIEARRNWGRFVRDTLNRTERWDSPGQVEAAVDAGELRYTQGPEKLRISREREAMYNGRQVFRWLDQYAVLDVVTTWLKNGPGIIWTDHVEFGRQLAGLLSLPYYGEGGLNAFGGSIEAEDGTRPIVASVDANGTGRNLQAFHRNLIMAPRSGGLDWEQTLARTHRPGQLAEEVTCDVLLGCAEHLRSVQEARRQTSAVLEREGLRWRLGYCDLNPKWYEACTRIGWRWGQPPR